MNKHQLISLIHILINGPLMIYIGYFKPKNMIFHWILLILGILLVIDIIYRYIQKKIHAWLIVHLILFAPLFIYTGYLGIRKEKIPYYLHSFILAIGIAALGYHLIKLI